MTVLVAAKISPNELSDGPFARQLRAATSDATWFAPSSRFLTTKKSTIAGCGEKIKIIFGLKRKQITERHRHSQR
jgi:hypothetical protein